MAKQIIVTKDNYGIEIIASLVNQNKESVDVTGQIVEVVIVDDNDTIVDKVEAQHIDSSRGIVSITLQKEHTSTIGLYKTYWSALDKNNNVTAQEDIYYYCKDKNGGASNDSYVQEEKFDNESIIDKFKETDAEIEGIKQDLSHLHKVNVNAEVVDARGEYDTLGERLDVVDNDLTGVHLEMENINASLDNIMFIVNSNLSRYEIQEAINNYNNIKFLQGEYNFDIDESTGIIFNIPSNKNIIFENGAILNINPNGNKGYKGFLVDSVENVTLNNITIVGDKYTHLGTEGEWGNGLEIKNSKNVKIINPKISKCWGDGIYLNNNENTVVEKAILDDNRRQGISYICGVNDTINNPIVTNTSGINPQFGIDIEPNYPSEKIINLVINNPYFKGNDNGGLQIHLKKFDETTEPCDITINNMISDNNKFQLSGFEKPFSGIIVLNNPIFKNCESIPFMIRAKHYKSARLIVNNLYVEDFACGENASVYDTAIALNLVGAELTDKVGGIDFINPVIKTSSNTVNNSVYFLDTRETKSILSDINFINPDFPITKKGHIRKDIDDGTFFIEYTDKISKINTSLGSLFQFTDDAPIVTLTNTGSVGVHMYLESLPISMQQKYTINAYSGQTTIHFRPLGSTSEYLQAIVRPLTTTPINSLKTRNKGKIVFKKIGENEIIIDDIVGDWEVN